MDGFALNTGEGASASTLVERVRTFNRGSKTVFHNTAFGGHLLKQENQPNRG